MARSFAWGLDLVAGNPNLTFIFFIGLSLLAAIGFRFGTYAFLNMRATGLANQKPIWEYLIYVGAAATLYGVLGLLEIVSTFRAPAKQGVMLALLLFLSMSFRQIHVTASTSTATPGSVPRVGLVPGRRAIEWGLGLVVAAVVVGMVLLGFDAFLIALEGVAAVAITAYGFWYNRRQTSQALVSGTMIDTLLRQLLPVLLFGGMVNVLDLVIVGGLNRAIVLHVRVVFVIVTATALMTATIKLRQNLASL